MRTEGKPSLSILEKQVTIDSFTILDQRPHVWKLSCEPLPQRKGKSNSSCSTFSCGQREISNSNPLQLSFTTKEGRKNLETLVNFIVQRHGLIKRLRSNHTSIEHLLFPTSHHHISKNLFVAVLFYPSTSCVAIKKKLHVLPKEHPMPPPHTI